MIKKLAIAGSTEEFNMNARILHLFCFVLICGCIFGVLSNFMFRLPFELNVGISVTAFLFSGIYYLSRYKKKTNFVKPFFTALVILLTDFSWFYNQGVEGSIAITFVLIFFIVSSIYPSKNIFLITFLVLINIAALLYLQYNYPELIIKYPDHDSQFADLSSGLLFCIFIFAFFISVFVKSYEEEHKKVEQQKIELEKTYIELSRKNKHITASILYASKIQQALLPQYEIMNALFPENFIFYRPRDIVSGDFYWAKRIRQYNILIAADCTGHGIPGAFMSILGISLLNEIVAHNNAHRPDHVLNELRQNIKKLLRQKGNINEQRDGMDISICSYDTATQRMYFSGANNPLWIIRDTQNCIEEHNSSEISDLPRIIEYKADKMPVGYYLYEKVFTLNEIQLYENDLIYLFSDGFVDQLNDATGKKFQTKLLKEYLITISKLDMDSQCEKLETKFNSWRGRFQQIDDVMIIGVKI